MRTIIAGCRTFRDREAFHRGISSLDFEPKLIITNGTEGASLLGWEWGGFMRIPRTTIRADWIEYPDGAEQIRNAEMVKQAEALVAFWDGEALDVADVIGRARQTRLRVQVFDLAGQPR